MAQTSEELSDITLRWQAEANPGDRKRLGQYMTPRRLRDRLVEQLTFPSGARVLDPGVGTGEFLATVHERHPDAELHGWDIDPGALAYARQLVPTADLTERSALDPYSGEQFDVVLGNPPYFQMKASRAVRTYYARVISGRPNIFALFFQAGIEALRPGGQLGYVVPPSMNNGAYFDRLREYLLSVGSIDFLEVYTDSYLFDGAQTPVQLIVITKGATDSGKHTFIRQTPGSSFRRILFMEDPDTYRTEFVGRSTLYDLGYEAVTGSIVWNQNRHRLEISPTEDSVPLIWAHNVLEELTLQSRPGKPQYIRHDQPLTGPAIVVNRIVGSVGTGRLRCVLVPDGMRFLAENHTNVVRPHREFDPVIALDELLCALRDPRFTERARRLTGNTQISAKELTHLLPVDV